MNLLMRFHTVQYDPCHIKATLATLIFAIIIVTGCSDSPTDPGVGNGNGNDNGNGENDTHVVEMVGHSFTPQVLEIEVGTTVVWLNESNESHTVTSGSNREHDGRFDSGNVPPGDSYTYTFDETGSYDYYCIPHVGMDGTIEVVEEAGTGTSDNEEGGNGGDGY